MTKRIVDSTDKRVVMPVRSFAEFILSEAEGLKMTKRIVDSTDKRVVMPVRSFATLKMTKSGVDSTARRDVMLTEGKHLDVTL